MSAYAKQDVIFVDAAADVLSVNRSDKQGVQSLVRWRDAVRSKMLGVESKI